MAGNLVYGLIQKSTKQLIYIGRTGNVDARLRHHKASTFKNLKGDIELEVLDEGGFECESFWIQYALFMGCKLANVSGRRLAKGVYARDAASYKRVSVKLTEDVWMELQGVQPKTGIPANVFAAVAIKDALKRLKEKEKDAA